MSEVRFDEASKTFEVYVRELAEDEGFRRVGFDRGDGWRRLGLGTQVHSRVLAARASTHTSYRSRGAPPGPRPGRGLDGGPDGTARRLRRAVAGQWLIEEFKSTNLSVEGIRPCRLCLRAGPAAAARLLLPLAAAGPRTRLRARSCTWTSRRAKRSRSTCPYDGDGGDRRIEARLARLPRRSGGRRRSVARRKARGGRTACPFRTRRRGPIQEKLMEAVAHRARAGREPARRVADGVGQDRRRALPRSRRTVCGPASRSSS